MRAVLFDLDNTLILKSPTIVEKWHELLENAGCNLNVENLDYAYAMCETWVGEQIRRENESGNCLSDEEFLDGVMSCAVTNLNIDGSYKEILSTVWMGNYEKQYKTAQGAVALLKSLRSKGFKLGVVSNNSSEIRATLSDLGLDKFFDIIVISEEINIFKPDPEILLYACNKLQVNANDAIYVGDHPFDVICANAASVLSAWIPINRYMILPDNTPKPAYCIKSLYDLMDILC